MSQPETYVGLDVSLETTSLCVVDGGGAIMWRGTCSTDAAELAAVIRKRAPDAVRIGLETGQLSNWLTLSLRNRGLPVLCLDARHAKAALKMQINKTDANDAWGLAQVVRTGWFREVAVKSMDASQLRTLLVARSQLVGQRQNIANSIRGLLKGFGLVIPRGCKGPFAVNVRAVAGDNDAVMAIIEPLLTVWQTLREQIAVYDREINGRAKADATVQRLMTAPGIGVVIALAYTAGIDDPARFKPPSSVGAYLGLTPRRYQSGEVDISGHISRGGDRHSATLRQALAAQGLGAEARQARRHAPREGRFGAQARRPAASRLARRHRVRVQGRRRRRRLMQFRPSHGLCAMP